MHCRSGNIHKWFDWQVLGNTRRLHSEACSLWLLNLELGVPVSLQIWVGAGKASWRNELHLRGWLSRRFQKPSKKLTPSRQLWQPAVLKCNSWPGSCSLNRSAARPCPAAVDATHAQPALYEVQSWTSQNAQTTSQWHAVLQKEAKRSNTRHRT